VKILVISWNYFREGFNELFEEYTSFDCIDRNSVWNKKTLYSKIRYGSSFDILHYFPGKITFFEVLFLRFAGKKIILHFIGTDVMNVITSKRRSCRLKLFQWLGCHIVTVHNRLIEELQSVGINAKLVPFVNRVLSDHEFPLPKQFSVLAYVPQGREKHFCLELIEKAARTFDDVLFTLFPNDYHNKDIPNISSIPHVSHNKIIQLFQDHSVFIRLTVHDGLPNTILEALSCARPVVWSFKEKYCYVVKDEKQLISTLQRIRDQNKLNKEGKQYVLKRYDAANLRMTFHSLWKKAMS